MCLFIKYVVKTEWVLVTQLVSGRFVEFRERDDFSLHGTMDGQTSFLTSWTTDGSRSTVRECRVRVSRHLRLFLNFVRYGVVRVRCNACELWHSSSMDTRSRTHARRLIDTRCESTTVIFQKTSTYHAVSCGVSSLMTYFTEHDGRAHFRGAGTPRNVSPTSCDS